MGRSAGTGRRRGRGRRPGRLGGLGDAPGPARPPSTPCGRSRWPWPPSTASRCGAATRPALHVLVDRPRPRPGQPEVRALLGGAGDDPLFASLAVRAPGGRLTLVYKAAAEIGELGDNVARPARRHRRRPAPGPGPGRARRPRRPCSATPAGPASGIISEANAHPLNSDEIGRRRRPVRHRRPQRRRRQLRRAPAVGGPVASRPRSPPTPRSSRPWSRAGWPRATPSTRPSGRRWPASRVRWPSPRRRAGDPDQLHLALRGRGSRSTSAWPRTPSSWPASPTGWSRRPRRYVRMDGEATQGQVVALDRGRRRDPGRDDRAAATTAAPLPLDERRRATRPRSPPGTSTGAAFPTSS